MRTTRSDGSLVISLGERIDATTASALERDLVSAIGDAADTMRIVLDATDLAYISSAGLRVFVRLQRRLGGSLEISEVSPEIYDVFHMTGLTKILDVRRRLRNISIEGLAIVGQGGNGTVYRLSDEEVVKVFRPWRTPEEIEAERESTREALLLGVPCAILFDTVRVGNGLGTVMELINAKSVVAAIKDDPESLEPWGARLGTLFAEIHAIEVPESSTFKDACAMIVHDRIDCVRGYYTPDEIELMHELMSVIPSGRTFVHGDYHPANVMVTGDDELMLVDLDVAGYGHPLIDLLHTKFFMCHASNEIGTKSEDDLSFLGLSFRDLRRLWKALLVAYVGDARAAERLDEQMEPYMWLSGLVFVLGHAGYHEWLKEDNVRITRTYLKDPGQFLGIDFPPRVTAP